MKINEILKLENVSKKFNLGRDTFQVQYGGSLELICTSGRVNYIGMRIQDIYSLEKIIQGNFKEVLEDNGR